MEPVERRKISEVVQLYRLEPTLRDIYVEGISDNLIIESFLEENNIMGVSIYEIDKIDLPSKICQSSCKICSSNCLKEII